MADAFQTQIERTASTWRAAARAANARAGLSAEQHIEQRSKEWLDEMEPLVAQFDSWSSYEHHVALGIMSEIERRAEARQAGEPGIDLPSEEDVHKELDKQEKTYDYLRWLGRQIIAAFAGPRTRVGSEARKHTASEWFQHGVLARVDQAEFDGERSEARTGAIAELDAVWAALGGKKPRNPATGRRVAASGSEQLPSLSDTEHFSALDAFLKRVDDQRRWAEDRAIRWALLAASEAARGTASVEAESEAVKAAIGKLAWWAIKAEPARVVDTVRHALDKLKTQESAPTADEKRLAIIAALGQLRLSAERSHARGVPARSLAHRSMGRVELSARQSAVYGRARAGW
ncbi:uncharacterized protein RHOBADRAFT_46350 [Rhodotorula graminis WP1]|uniref:Uncharacterized protein n=1 Tax=Rhodotorula graminis (strain WP1) TaxID=578459 RepID=A0A0P9EZV9_RHOGW|nr:uncharacterized protein RHOBADRAFT_46350 [Rhodotorula graminis WP1]KPV72755.1 hypothetical protein RHOBADRAFT_46350 [Rhodotorula graminis WP1]